MTRALSIIGAPTSAGAYAPGQEKAPAAFRRHGLREALARDGRRITDRGDGPFFRWRPDLEHPDAMNLDAVAHTARSLADTVADVMAADENVLVLGGDCTIELGTVAGALRASDSVGLIYIDYDVDLNTPETSDGALDWTGVAHLLGVAGVEDTLAGLGPRRPMLTPDAVLYVGADNVSEAESHTLRALRIERISSAEIRSNRHAASERAAAWAARFERILIHFDVDVLTFTEFPLAENVRRCRGLSLDEAFAVIEAAARLPNWRGLTVTEINPDHAPDERETFSGFIGKLSAALA